MSLSAAPGAFHVMAKPVGAACNLCCAYCFYLPKAALHAADPPRMPDEVLEAYLRQTLGGQRAPFATLAWQGGEPTLAGLDFFRRAVAAEERSRPPGMRVERTLQTNGLLLDEAWCRFLREEGFLVGLSLDGPRELHDAFRVDAAGRPTFDRVLAAARLLREHGVEHNVLCAVHAANAARPREVYRFLRDEVGVRHLQFIPIVEPQGRGASARSVGGERYGEFLVAVFDEWRARDVGETFVLNFDAALANWLGAPTACIFSPTCGTNPALERNGDLYACDHFVDPAHRLGNILETPIAALLGAPAQRAFGEAKRDALPRQCRECDVRFACHGECPKNRFAVSADGEPGLNWLCAGYRRFFRHADRALRLMAALLREGREAREAAALLAEEDREFAARCRGLGRNEPCPCGGGRKVKHCHGRG